MAVIRTERYPFLETLHLLRRHDASADRKSTAMTFFGSIASQYLLETLVFATLVFAALLPVIRRREPRAVLAVLAGLNMLRFGGVAGALAAVRGSVAPAFLYQVAAGDGVTAIAAVVAFVLLRRRSVHAARALAAMNVLGLLGILVSETWLQCLDLGGAARGASLHGPTVGAAFFTTVHILVFHLLPRVDRRSIRRDAPRAMPAAGSALPTR
jgi:hypothetical protein